MFHIARVEFNRLKQNTRDFDRKKVSEWYQKTMEEVIKALRKIPDQSQQVKWYLKLGQHFEETFGDHENAKKYLLRYLEWGSDNAPKAAHYYLGLAYYHTGEETVLKQDAGDSKAASEVRGLEDEDVLMPQALTRVSSANFEQLEDLKKEMDNLPDKLRALYHLEEARDFKDADSFRKTILCFGLRETFGFKSTDDVPDSLQKEGRMQYYGRLFENNERLRTQREENEKVESALKAKTAELEKALAAKEDALKSAQKDMEFRLEAESKAREAAETAQRETAAKLASALQANEKLKSKGTKRKHPAMLDAGSPGNPQPLLLSGSLSSSSANGNGNGVAPMNTSNNENENEKGNETENTGTVLGKEKGEPVQKKARLAGSTKEG